MDRMTHQYHLWLEKATQDQDIIQELKSMEGSPEKIRDAFYQDLTFGTGGLRGIIGAGTNRMNIYTVAKASHGLASYIKKNLPENSPDCKIIPKVAVSYDSRMKSTLFAQTACRVLAANGIQAWLYPQLMPTPCLSFAVRELGCLAGVMITASHNPAAYNGYKVYGPDGCQITTQAAKEILEEIRQADLFSDLPLPSFEDGIRDGDIRYIPDSIYSSYIQAVKGQALAGYGTLNRQISIVYSPLNGTGLEPVLCVLKESGFTHITVVEEQRMPDGRFPTCPYPNPEVREAMNLGIQYAKDCHGDLVLATDPDCDRVGIAVKDKSGEYVLLSGNETGMLLLDYICWRHFSDQTMPENPLFIKTIVTTNMAERIASHYGVRTVNVLTGFKYIGEQLGILETEGREDSFLFAFEESYGYLRGTYVRDKDGVSASLLICEMASFYQSQGLSLLDRLEELYHIYGYCLETQHSYTFEGAQGASQMQEIMEKFRTVPGSFGSKKVVDFLDYKDGLDGLPKSDVVRFLLEDHCSVVIRPSGTEPKIKVYVSVSGGSREEAGEIEGEIVKGIEKYLRSI